MSLLADMDQSDKLVLILVLMGLASIVLFVLLLSYGGRAFRYISDLLRCGFVVRHIGGRGGIVVYSEGWRHAKFEYEIGVGEVGVYVATGRWWRLPLGVPFLRLSDKDNEKIIARMKEDYSGVVAW